MATRIASDETVKGGNGTLPAVFRDEPARIASAREEAWAHYQALPVPERSSHLWRYTDPAEFALADRPVLSLSPGEVAIDIDRRARSAGVVVVPLADAAAAMPGLVGAHLGRLVGPTYGKPEALNLALWSAGHLVRIPRGVQLETPIRITTTLGGERGFRAVRNLIVFEEGSSGTIVEESRGPGDDSGHSLNEVTELFAGPNCRIRIVPLQHLGRGVVSHRTLGVRLARDAHLLTVVASFGAGLYKADIRAQLDGPGAESRIIGVCLADERQRVDHHTVQDHRGQRTRSDIDFRVVLAGRARSAYTGLIRIAQDAPFCEAYQENRNLLLSDSARAESIPELEILTDEVRCKHGATVGPIDPEQLFYLGSRGLSPAGAMRMIVTGFLEAALVHLPEDLVERLRGEMAHRLEEIARR